MESDIARGVSTTIDSAERLKTLYSSLISAPSDEYEIIEVPIISGENDKFVQINRLKINSIVKPRVEETLEMIWQKLKQNNFHNSIYELTIFNEREAMSMTYDCNLINSI